MWKSFLFEGLKVKSVFVLIFFCFIWTVGKQTYFFTILLLRAMGFWYYTKEGIYFKYHRARPRNQGCESVTWKLDFVTWDATLDIFFSLIDPATAEKFIYCNQYYFTFASVKNYSLWSIAIRQMDRNGSINGDETQDLYLPLFQKTKNIHTRETANGIILNLQPCREDLECALEKNCKYHNQEAAISLCNTGEL